MGRSRVVVMIVVIRPLLLLYVLNVLRCERNLTRTSGGFGRKIKRRVEVISKNARLIGNTVS
jgi:hypothetical protein